MPSKVQRRKKSKVSMLKIRLTIKLFRNLVFDGFCFYACFIGFSNLIKPQNIKERMVELHHYLITGLSFPLIVNGK